MNSSSVQLHGFECLRRTRSARIHPSHQENAILGRTNDSVAVCCFPCILTQLQSQRPHPKVIERLCEDISSCIMCPHLGPNFLMGSFPSLLTTITLQLLDIMSAQKRNDDLELGQALIKTVGTIFFRYCSLPDLLEYLWSVIRENFSRRGWAQFSASWLFPLISEILAAYNEALQAKQVVKFTSNQLNFLKTLVVTGLEGAKTNLPEISTLNIFILTQLLGNNETNYSPFFEEDDCLIELFPHLPQMLVSSLLQTKCHHSSVKQNLMACCMILLHKCQRNRLKSRPSKSWPIWFEFCCDSPNADLEIKDPFDDELCEALKLVLLSLNLSVQFASISFLSQLFELWPKHIMYILHENGLYDYVLEALQTQSRKLKDFEDNENQCMREHMLMDLVNILSASARLQAHSFWKKYSYSLDFVLQHIDNCFSLLKFPQVQSNAQSEETSLKNLVSALGLAVYIFPGHQDLPPLSLKHACNLLVVSIKAQAIFSQKLNRPENPLQLSPINLQGTLVNAALFTRIQLTLLPALSFRLNPSNMHASCFVPSESLEESSSIKPLKKSDLKSPKKISRTESAQPILRVECDYNMTRQKIFSLERPCSVQSGCSEMFRLLFLSAKNNPILVKVVEVASNVLDFIPTTDSCSAGEKMEELKRQLNELKLSLVGFACDHLLPIFPGLDFPSDDLGPVLPRVLNLFVLILRFCRVFLPLQASYIAKILHRQRVLLLTVEGLLHIPAHISHSSSGLGNDTIISVLFLSELVSLLLSEWLPPTESVARCTDPDLAVRKSLLDPSAWVDFIKLSFLGGSIDRFVQILLNSTEYQNTGPRTPVGASVFPIVLLVLILESQGFDIFSESIPNVLTVNTKRARKNESCASLVNSQVLAQQLLAIMRKAVEYESSELKKSNSFPRFGEGMLSRVGIPFLLWVFVDLECRTGERLRGDHLALWFQILSLDRISIEAQQFVPPKWATVWLWIWNDRHQRHHFSKAVYIQFVSSIALAVQNLLFTLDSDVKSELHKLVSMMSSHALNVVTLICSQIGMNQDQNVDKNICFSSFVFLTSVLTEFYPQSVLVLDTLRFFGYFGCLLAKKEHTKSIETLQAMKHLIVLGINLSRNALLFINHLLRLLVGALVQDPSGFSITFACVDVKATVVELAFEILQLLSVQVCESAAFSCDNSSSSEILILLIESKAIAVNLLWRLLLSESFYKSNFSVFLALAIGGFRPHVSNELKVWADSAFKMSPEELNFKYNEKRPYQAKLISVKNEFRAAVLRLSTVLVAVANTYCQRYARTSTELEAFPCQINCDIGFDSSIKDLRTAPESFQILTKQNLSVLIGLSDPRLLTSLFHHVCVLTRINLVFPCFDNFDDEETDMLDEVFVANLTRERSVDVASECKNLTLSAPPVTSIMAVGQATANGVELINRWFL
jgi:hypothetical protein